MQNQTLMYEYLNWATVIFTVIGLFNYYCRIHKSLIRLILLTLIPAWLIAAVIRGFIHLATDGLTLLLSLRGFTILLAETLLVVIIFGGITFFFKYRKFKKGGLSQYDKSREKVDINTRIKQKEEYGSLIEEIGKKEEK